MSGAESGSGPEFFDAVDALIAENFPLPSPAERVRLRKAHGLSQAQVAKTLKVRSATVISWEAGKTAPRSPQREAYARLLRKLAEFHPPPDDTTASASAVSADPSPVSSAEVAEEATVPAGSRQPPAAQADSRRPVRRLPAQQQPEVAHLITERVRAALTEHEGDTEAAAATLVHKAIPDVMELLEVCRQGGRYDFSRHPSLPDLLHKQPGRDADDIWEARPMWVVSSGVLVSGEYTVTVLDMNAAYLSALKTHLPIGALEHHLGPDAGGPAWDRRRSGVHCISAPEWPHPYMPNPLGNREEPGPLWVTEATLRLLQRAAVKGWCEQPAIHESWTSGASEGLLDKLRVGLSAARRTALEAGDEVTVEYVKAMYAKLVSTMGASNYNRGMYRPDWVHQIRAQAFANLWHKAEKAHHAGLQVVRMQGTDELHVVGDWRRVFVEGRDVARVKVKDVYTLQIAGEGE